MKIMRHIQVAMEVYDCEQFRCGSGEHKSQLSSYGRLPILERYRAVQFDIGLALIELRGTYGPWQSCHCSCYVFFPAFIHAGKKINQRTLETHLSCVIHLSQHQVCIYLCQSYCWGAYSCYTVRQTSSLTKNNTTLMLSAMEHTSVANFKGELIHATQI